MLKENKNNIDNFLKRGYSSHFAMLTNFRPPFRIFHCLGWKRRGGGEFEDFCSSQSGPVLVGEQSEAILWIWMENYIAVQGVYMCVSMYLFILPPYIHQEKRYEA